MSSKTVKASEVLVASKEGCIAIDHEAQGLRLEFTDIDELDDYLTRLLNMRSRAFPLEDSLYTRNVERGKIKRRRR